MKKLLLLINRISFKKLAWYCAGIVLSYSHFDLMAHWVVTGFISNSYTSLAVSSSLCLLIGAALCHRHPTKDIAKMGLVIAGYLPAIISILYFAALVQDLLRGQGLPGQSLTVMMSLPNISSLLAMMLTSGVQVFIGGWAAMKLTKKIKNRATNKKECNA